MTHIAAERGLAQATVGLVVARSGVSRRTYYEIFPDREACFLASLSDAVEKAGEYVLPAYRTRGSWRQRIRSSVAATLSFLEAEPHMARLLVVESLAASPAALKRRREVLTLLTAAVHEGQSAPRSRTNLPPLTAEATVGAVLSVIHTRLTTTPLGQDTPGSLVAPTGSPTVAPTGSLVALTGPLTALILTPYLGPTAAQQELARPAPPPAQRIAPSTDTASLSHLPIRLTHRTLAVIAAIASNPGASNRRISRTAGIADQGQASKLLARLATAGLIQNSGDTHLRGGPNAWTLTPQGARVHAAIGGTRDG